MSNYTTRRGNHRQGALVYLHGHFQYKPSKDAGGRLYLKCTSHDCAGTAVLHKECQEIVGLRAHGHGGEKYSDTLELKNILKEAAQDDRTVRSNRELFNRITREHPLGHRISFG